MTCYIFFPILKMHHQTGTEKFDHYKCKKISPSGTTPPGTTPLGTESNTGAIIGGTTAGVITLVALVISLIGCFFYYKKRHISEVDKTYVLLLIFFRYKVTFATELFLPSVNILPKVGQPWIANRADPIYEYLISRVTIMAQLKFTGLFTLSHGSNRNWQGGVSLRCDLLPLVVVGRHFHVAGLNFDEILQNLLHP